MTKKLKRLKDKSRTPNKFSVHISTPNLERINEIMETEQIDIRNECLNFIIERFYLYYNYKPLIEALKKLKVGID